MLYNDFWRNAMRTKFLISLSLILVLLMLSCQSSKVPEGPELDMPAAEPAKTVEVAKVEKKPAAVVESEKVEPSVPETPAAPTEAEKPIQVASPVEKKKAATYLEAIEADSVEKLQEAFDAGEPLEAAISDNMTPLAYALVNGSDQMVLKLLELGADAKVIIDIGTGDMTTLETALLINHGDEVVEALLDSGADPDVLCCDGYSLFEHAIDADRVNAIEIIALAGADIDIVDTVNNVTPLYYAVVKGSLACCEKLLDLGADPNAVNAQGYPLIFAIAYSGRAPELMDRAVKAGADLDGRDNLGGTLPEYAASLLNPKALDYVLAYYSRKGVYVDFQELVGFVIYGSSDQKYEMVGVLLKRGLDINGQTADNGVTPLMMACNAMDVDFVKKIIALGARAGELNYYGDDAFMYSLENDSNPEVAAVIAEANGGVNRYRDNGKTCLMEAATYAIEPAILEKLIAAGADVNKIDKVDDDAKCNAILYAAMDNPNPDVIDVLVKGGADAKSADAFGESALMLACFYNNNPEVAKRLILHGADVNKGREDTGDTPLMYAVQNENRAAEMTRILLESGADPAIINNYNETALSIATDIQAEDAAKLLKAFTK